MAALNAVSNFFTELFTSFEKPLTHGARLEAYIVSNNPQNADDIDRLTREYEQNGLRPFHWGRGS